MTLVRHEPATPGSGVKHSTNEPLRSLSPCIIELIKQVEDKKYNLRLVEINCTFNQLISHLKFL